MLRLSQVAQERPPLSAPSGTRSTTLSSAPMALETAASICFSAHEGDRQEIGHLHCVETIADSTAEDIDDLPVSAHAQSVLLFARESNPGC